MIQTLRLNRHTMSNKHIGHPAYMSDEEEEVTYGSLSIEYKPLPKKSLAEELQEEEEAVKREAAFESVREATRNLLRRKPQYG
jgi:hypothetical protein